MCQAVLFIISMTLNIIVWWHCPIQMMSVCPLPVCDIPPMGESGLELPEAEQWPLPVTVEWCSSCVQAMSSCLPVLFPLLDLYYWEAVCLCVGDCALPDPGAGVCDVCDQLGSWRALLLFIVWANLRYPHLLETLTWPNPCSHSQPHSSVYEQWCNWLMVMWLCPPSY